MVAADEEDTESMMNKQVCKNNANAHLDKFFREPFDLYGGSFYGNES
jgi:hypothetical protein